MAYEINWLRVIYNSLQLLHQSTKMSCATSYQSFMEFCIGESKIKGSFCLNSTVMVVKGTLLIDQQCHNYAWIHGLKV